MELIAIAQKTIQPDTPSRPQAPGARASHRVPGPEPTSFGALPALGWAERDAFRAALRLLQTVAIGLEAHHTDNHQG